MGSYKVPHLGDFQWQPPVKDKDLTAPPGGESKGDRYIVGVGATGAWEGEDGNIAQYNGSGWDFTDKREGMFVYIEDEDKLYRYITSWSEYIPTGTRFVAIDPAKTALSTNPANTNWTDLDVTAHTSANAYAVTGTVLIRATTAGRAVFMRKNGSTDTSTPCWKASNPVAGQYGTSGFTVGVDANQIFEWSVSNADVDTLIINICGYWETI